MKCFYNLFLLWNILFVLHLFVQNMEVLSNILCRENKYFLFWFFFFAFMICDISSMCLIFFVHHFIFENFIFQNIFKKKDIKLFFTGGEKSILNFSKLLVLYIFFIINVILKGGEIVLNFYIFSNFSYIYILPKYFQIILTYVISYIFLKYFWNSKEWILLLKCFLRIHTLKHKGGETIFA